MTRDISLEAENQILKSRIAAMEQLIEVYEKSVLENSDELHAEIARRKKVEEALALIQKAVESSSEAIGISNPQGSHFYQNKAFLDLFEYSVEELNKPLAPIVVYADSEVGCDVFETIMRGDPWIGETIVVAKSGRRFPVFLRADAVKDENGSIIGLIGIHTDITKSKRAEEDLRESQEYAKVLFTSSHIPLIVMDAETGRFIDSNAAAAKISGFATREELLGKTSLDVSAPIQYNGSDSATEVKKHDQACRENGSHVFEWRSQTHNGQIWDAEIHLMSFQHRGKPLVQFTLQDITERKKADQALRESEAKFRILFESANDAILLLDQNVFIDCNQKTLEMFGCTREQIIGQTTYRFSPEIQPDGRKSIEKAQEEIATALSGQTQFFEWKHSHYDGSLFDAEVALNAFTTAGKYYLQVVVRDITERKRAEEELRTLNEKLEEKVGERTSQLLQAQEELVRKEKLSILGLLAGLVGHEIRNPLGVMNNAVYFLKTILPDADDTVKEYLDIIKKEIDNSLRIINDLLDFARTRPPHAKQVAIASLINQGKRKCVIPENIAVDIEIPETPLMLWTDPAQIEQVFQNLITNAVQAMTEGGELRIAARRVQGLRYKVQGYEGEKNEQETFNLQDGIESNTEFVEISIKDSGGGISPENMKRLFQPLFTTKTKGIGLGLVVCKNLVEANGGKIDAKSDPDKGTTFTVTLPAEKAMSNAH